MTPTPARATWSEITVTNEIDTEPPPELKAAMDRALTEWETMADRLRRRGVTDE